MSRKRRSTLGPEAAADPNEAIVYLMASLGLGYDTIGLSLDPPCSGSALKEHYREGLVHQRQNFLVMVGRALNDMLKGRPATFDKKGRLVSSEVKPNPTAVLFLIKSVIGLQLSPAGEWDTSLDLSKLTDRQLDDLLRRMQPSSPVDPKGSTPPAMTE
jgi:hypothetical protein